MIEVIILFSLALIWIIFATVEDIKTREIANWLNFSLVIFALSFRFFYSLFELNDFSFFYQGLIGYGIFFLLGNLFYYGKMFAGGDAKLMMSLGAILPISNNFFTNVKLFFMFITFFLIVGAIYGLSVSVYYGFKNFSKLRIEYKKQFKKNKKMIFFLLIFSILFLLLSFYEFVLIYFAVMIFILPYFYLYVKSVDEACMIKKIKPSKLTIGDWLYNDVKVGRRVIRATWDGVSEKDIKLLKKKKFIFVRYGVQFAPVFLIAFILFWITTRFDIFRLGMFFGF